MATSIAACEEVLASNVSACEEVPNSHLKTISIDQQEIHSKNSYIKEYCECSNNMDKYTSFCINHDCPLCNQCIKKHTGCCDVTPLEDVISNVKGSEGFQDILQSLQELEENLQVIKSEKEKNIIEIADQRRKFEDEIHEIRRKVNDHLDVLEKQMLDELNEAENKESKIIRESIQKIGQNVVNVREMYTALFTMKQNASDLQTFLEMKNVQSQLSQHEDFLQTINLKETFIECFIQPEISDHFRNIPSLGSVTVLSRSSNVKICRKQHGQAQVMMSPYLLSIRNIKPKFVTALYIQDMLPSISGVCVTERDEYIFTCQETNEIMLLQSNGSKKFLISLKSSGAFDIVLLSDTIAAVTSGDKKKHGITLVDISLGKSTKFIKLPGQSYGITSNEEYLFVAIKGKGIQMLNKENLKPLDIIRCEITDGSYIDEYNGIIYITNSSENKVLCCDMNGVEKWVFNRDDILKEPYGIGVDGRGNVYVVGGGTLNVVVLSPDGSQHRQLISDKRLRLTLPRALSFDRRRKRINFANEKKFVFVYNIEY
ncbi:uncharacterized protein LOC127706350 [Mytilus californianus]|uniref:uncharacterized protein LOC127706350 n=1 Tax=Mytilus californianus TaxID=6549 RepID=UPI0022466A8E|nr:uncharacterized protein LOC127706350 [Mytilus californianus]